MWAGPQQPIERLDLFQLFGILQLSNYGKHETKLQCVYGRAIEWVEVLQWSPVSSTVASCGSAKVWLGSVATDTSTSGSPRVEWKEFEPW